MEAILNLMTSRVEPVAVELGAARGHADQGGGVAVDVLLLPGGAAAARVAVVVRRSRARRPLDLGLAVRCPACRRTSVNVVSCEHVDIPFWNDREVGVVEHVFPDDLHASVEEFRAELWSSAFDARRLGLE